MNLAIISTNRHKYSETFIQNHVKCLPATIHFLFDGYLPKQYSTDKGVTAHSIFKYAKKSVFNILNRNEEDPHVLCVTNYLKKNKIDVILCEYGPGGVEMMPIVLRLNIPLVVHFHGYDAYRDDVLNSYGQKYRDLFAIAASIIAVSRHMQSQLISLGCPLNKLKYLCYGIDTSIFNFAKHSHHPATFVSCGRFVEKKAPELVIKAFAIVLRKTPNSKLVMIGDGELLERCKNLTHELKIASAIEFTGALTQPQIAERFKAATVFIQHSITTPQNDSEGTPLTIMEAMASGLPVITTKHGGIPDVIQHKETGLLVNEGDVAAMANEMIYLIENPQFAKELGEAAARYISTHHTLNRYTQQLYELIESVKK